MDSLIKYEHGIVSVNKLQLPFISPPPFFPQQNLKTTSINKIGLPAYCLVDFGI